MGKGRAGSNGEVEHRGMGREEVRGWWETYDIDGTKQVVGGEAKAKRRDVRVWLAGVYYIARIWNGED